MKIENKTFDEERALYGIENAEIINCIFDGIADGESACKETSGLTVENCFFNLRYPFWHTNNTAVRNSEMTKNCRAALWYDKNIIISGCVINGIKALRECSNISLENCRINSPEFSWKCSDINLKGCSLQSEYPFFECHDMKVENLTMNGKYSFQYVENAVIKNSDLNTKDAFWHSKNVTVIDSTVRGEYLGWYSEKLSFINCRIIGTQPLCYCKNLTLKNCTMEQTDLCFEYSEVNADITGFIKSIKNPLCGIITAERIDNIIMDSDRINPENTKINYRQKNKEILL